MTLSCALQIDFYQNVKIWQTFFQKVSLEVKLDKSLFCSLVKYCQNIKNVLRQNSCQHSWYLAAPLWCIIFTGGMNFSRNNVISWEWSGWHDSYFSADLVCCPSSINLQITWSNFAGSTLKRISKRPSRRFLTIASRRKR